MLVVTYERPDGTLGQMWSEDWCRILEMLAEAGPDEYYLGAPST
jgi:hypothetical protein